MNLTNSESALVLIVEDEAKLSALLDEYLTASNYRTLQVADGLDVVGLVRERTPDVILLDLMLPGRDGMDICRELRTFSNVPIIMMTARVEEVDRLLGLDAGADDYICKPYSPREVVARVKAILRRRGPVETSLPDHQSEGLVLEPTTMRASWNGMILDLTQFEWKLLAALMTSPGRIFSRSQLVDKLYDDGRSVTDRTIDSHIRNLRRKLESAVPEKELIRSVYGVGYSFEPDK
jgi:two-component system, OmpR family, response regulator BaeR